MGYFIVENYYNSKTVEQKAMFTLYNNMMNFPKKNCQIVAKCEHEFYSILVVFNDVNTVRLEM